MRKEKISVEATVKEEIKGDKFVLELGNGWGVKAYMSGKMFHNHIRVLPGDKVLVELCPYDLTQGRIVYRLKT